jgi:hypothetical protein
MEKRTVVKQEIRQPNKKAQKDLRCEGMGILEGMWKA